MSLLPRLRAALRAFLSPPQPPAPGPPPPPLDLPDSRLLAGKNALITGAGGIIGRSIAVEMAGQGANVYFTDIEALACDRLAEELRAFPVHSRGFLADITARDATDRLRDELDRSGLGIDILVNNAGRRCDFDDLGLAPEVWQSTYDANVFGPLYLTRHIAEAMRRDGRQGAILFVTSIHQWQLFLHPAYSSSKAALGMVIEELAAALAGSGIRVNGIAPGWVALDAHGAPLPSPYSLLHRCSIHPSYIGRAALYLASEHFSGCTTGTVLKIDAGATLHNYRLCQHPHAAAPGIDR